jgi:hypothetical protein
LELKGLERQEQGDLAQTDMQKLPNEDLLIGLVADDLAYSSDCDAEGELATRITTDYDDIFLASGAEEDLTGSCFTQKAAILHFRSPTVVPTVRKAH